MLHGKGYGVIETSKARCEGVAQWEIRNCAGIPITLELAKYNALRKEIGPRCWREGKCIEPKTFKTEKNICRAFKVAHGKWNKSLEELIELLKEPCESFKVQIL
jgi:hypothetical protein